MNLPVAPLPFTRLGAGTTDWACFVDLPTDPDLEVTIADCSRNALIPRGALTKVALGAAVLDALAPAAPLQRTWRATSPTVAGEDLTVSISLTKRGLTGTLSDLDIPCLGKLLDHRRRSSVASREPRLGHWSNRRQPPAGVVQERLPVHPGEPWGSGTLRPLVDLCARLIAPKPDALSFLAGRQPE